MIPSEVVPTPGRDLGDTSPSLGAQCPAKRRCALPRPSARTRCTLQRACNGAGRSQGRRFLEPLGRATSCRHSPATAVAAARMRRPAALSPPCLPCWWCLHLSSFAALSARRPSCSPRRQLQRPWSSSCLLRSPPCESHPSRASMAATAARPHPPPPPKNGRCPLPRAAVLPGTSFNTPSRSVGCSKKWHPSLPCVGLLQLCSCRARHHLTPPSCSPPCAARPR